MKPNTNFSTTTYLEEPVLPSDISKLLHTCDDAKNLMITIYMIEENKFLYCNKVFKTLLGFNPNGLIEKGWEFWFSLVHPCDVSRIKEKIFTFFKTPLARDVISMQYHITNFKGEKIYIKHEILIYKLKKRILALNYFFDVSEKEEIERCVKINGGHRGRKKIKNELDQISSREEEVLKLIANGYSSKQIADELFISNHTAVSHRKHLIKKFRVKNTAQLIKEASKLLEL